MSMLELWSVECTVLLSIIFDGVSTISTYIYTIYHIAITSRYLEIVIHYAYLWHCCCRLRLLWAQLILLIHCIIAICEVRYTLHPVLLKSS